MFPRRGIGGSLVLRGGVEGAGSDASFPQVHARASWFKGLGERNRLIVRGEIGHTFTDALTAMQPSLRFYAGVDRSIRGYQWREGGTRTGDVSIGAQHVVTTPGAFERSLTPCWGGPESVAPGT